MLSRCRLACFCSELSMGPVQCIFTKKAVKKPTTTPEQTFKEEERRRQREAEALGEI